MSFEWYLAHTQYEYIFEVMIKSINNYLIIFFLFQQFQSQMSQIDENGYNSFCNETLQLENQKP